MTGAAAVRAAGVFAEWQPRYAEYGVPTFPVEMGEGRKKPAVCGYLKVGARASAQFAMKFPDAAGIGLAVRRARLTVVDVDTPDERILADALDRHGHTPIIVRSGSGHFQAWYRHGGEARRIRPNPSLPIDILGGGFIVAPPSIGSAGAYGFVEGSLDDLERLPRMLGPAANDAAHSAATDLSAGRTQQGNRNNELFRWCMRAARQIGSARELMEAAMRHNAEAYFDPLPDREVLRVVASAIDYERSGRNYLGQGARLVLDHDVVDGLMHEAPDAFLLLAKLKRVHWGRQFVVANAMAESMPGGGWRRHRFAAARQALIERGLIVELRSASRTGGPALFEFKGVRI